MKIELFKKKHTDIVIFCFSHFFVDFSCTALMTLLALRHVPTLFSLTELALLYNGLAFALQMLVGAIADVFDLRNRLAAFGLLMVAAAFFADSPLLACILLGTGNAFFHVGGARNVLISSKGKMSKIGYFVAPGAIGIFSGPRLYDNFYITDVLLPLALVILAFLCIFVKKAEKQSNVSEVKGKWIPLVCFFVTVLLRAYMGTLLKYDINSDIIGAVIFTLAIFSGKFFGGLMGDRFGVLRFHLIAQPLCVLLLVLSLYCPLLAFPAILLFNTSMPITAGCLYKLFSELPGTTFGLTTLALYIGSLPSLAGIKLFSADMPTILVLSVISALSLLTGAWLTEGRDDK